MPPPLWAAVSPLRKAAKETSAAEFMQQHYQELSDEDKREVIARLEADAKEEYGAEVTIGDDRPIPGTKFVYAINLSVCNGNGKCVEACHKENNHDRATNQSYIRVLEMPMGTMDMEQGNTTYTHAVPDDGKFYLPVQCQQCDEPPCVDACPVQATWKEEDGIVVVDYNWCIGCRYCEAACPYHARRFNWKKPEVPADEVNPDQSYLSNRIRPAGRCREMHVLPAPYATRPIAGMLGSLPHRGSRVREHLGSRFRDPLATGKQTTSTF